MKWLVEERFTQPYEDGERTYAVRPVYAPTLFREVRQSGEEAMSLFLEEGGSLAKAMAFLQNGYSALHREQRRALRQTQKYLDLPEWHEDDQTERDAGPLPGSYGVPAPAGATAREQTQGGRFCTRALTSHWTTGRRSSAGTGASATITGR